MKIIIILLFIVISSVNCQTENDSPLDYLGQTPPGVIPEVFAPGIVSTDDWAEHCQMAVSPMGDEIFWSAWSAEYPTADMPNGEQLFYSKKVEGVWTKPALAEFIKDHLTNLNGGPVFSLDGTKLFFYSVDRPGGLGGMDTWYVEKINGEWGKPVNVGEPYNSENLNWTPIFTNKGNAYTFISMLKYNFDNSVFSNPDTVVFHNDYKPRFPFYVSPEESYVIFSAEKEDGFGGLDLYISFKDSTDNWGLPKNMGDKVNTEVTERFPVVSPDGKYMFFMRHTEPNQDFFWVSTDIFESLRE